MHQYKLKEEKVAAVALAVDVVVEEAVAVEEDVVVEEDVAEVKTVMNGYL
jgi:hypothetical protein